MRGLRGLGIQGLINPTFNAMCPGGGLFSTILSYNPVAYFPLNELSGLAAINYGSLGTTANGTYLGPTLAQTVAPGGELAPYFNGTTNFVNIYSAALNGGFSGTLNTIIAFCKVYNVGVWTDATTRRIVRIGVDDSTAYENTYKSTTNNRLVGLFKAESTDTLTYVDAVTTTDWFLFAMTVTDTGNELKLYLNSSQVGTTQTIVRTWAGVLSDTRCVIGAFNSAGLNPWYGYIAHVAAFSDILAQPQIATICAAGGV